ncbi:uncharacterized protein LOC128234360 [Mya arenaria]|uniref:uncharacterized protein LOC128234360 n=1 Tax=Mya arenaria TaxID=6604 RepID=UPI0022E4FD8B|nr:uncharacterized protein LOC128234360 [Mya arenaria]XP_052804519.1 uncharacterized protein LOC128234360 [Mya arenaria]
MGQIQSNQEGEELSALEGTSARMEAGSGYLSMEGKEGASNMSSVATASKEDVNKVGCVKSRIDNLIEKCLLVDGMLDQESEDSSSCSRFKGGNTNAKHKQQSRVEKEENNERKRDEDIKDKGNDDRRGSVEIIKVEEPKALNELRNYDDKNVDNGPEKENSKNDQIKVSDFISEKVNSEITQSHMLQIQKKTITTFNTFIDKVLDTTLQNEIVQEEVKTSEPSILELCNESLLQKGTEVKKEVSDLKSTCIPSESKKGKITLKDHIEKLLEQSIQQEIFTEDDNVRKPVKEVNKKPELLNAQGLINEMIYQGLKGDTGSPRSSSKSEISRKATSNSSENAQQRQQKINEKVMASKSQGLIGQSFSRDSNPMSQARGYEQHARSNQPDPRCKDIYNSNSKTDPRESYIHQAYRKNIPPERAPEFYGKQGMRNMEQQYTQHLHPFANNDYYRNVAAMGRLSPGQASDPRSYLLPRESKQHYHPRDCMCPMCLQSGHSQPKMDHLSVEMQREKYSPNMAPHLPNVYNYRESMVRPSHASLSPNYAYQTQQKVSPIHANMSPGKEHLANLMPPGEILSHSMQPGRRASIPENHPSVAAYRRKVNEDNRGYYQKSQNYAGPRPSSVPSQERPSPANIPSHQSLRPKEFTRTLSSHSGGSDSSDGPLDLSIKKPMEPMNRSRTLSNSAPHQQKRGSTVNSFIRHLENSVDKYWQEINSPSSSPNGSQSPNNHSMMSESGGIPPGYQGSSQSGNSLPSGPQQNYMPHRHLPSPQFAGGITVGQPLVNIERNQQTPGDVQYDSQSHSQPQISANASQQDGGRYSANNVSKHEPIQNIIGHHDPNDILYLICRLCTHTYGSPYAFRKHFRSNHGFEPRADHTIVQTISATKTAMHIPQTYESQEMMQQSRSPLEIAGTYSRGERNVHKGSVSPDDNKSHTSSDDSDGLLTQKSMSSEKSETKYLECPNCGKTFQLNDFGSYKRHCRQHGNNMSGPFTCTHCHLHFSDQKSLREHYIMHVKDNQKSDRDVDMECKIDIKVESPSQMCYPCNKCELKFDSIHSYTQHEASHSAADIKHGTNSMETVNIPKVKTENSTKDVDVVTSQTRVVKQAAESMTSQMCPDSSWDNVVKGIATSNKPDEVGSEDQNSPKSEITVDKLDDKSDTNSIQKVNDAPSECSDTTSQDSSDFLYKHKKFFHHRKRSSLTQDGPEAKVLKSDTEPPAVSSPQITTVSTPPKLTTVNIGSCDSSGSNDKAAPSPDMGIVKDDAPSKTMTSAPAKKEEKTAGTEVRTEARHNLPFVWDRPTRSQKKL